MINQSHVERLEKYRIRGQLLLLLGALIGGGASVFWPLEAKAQVPSPAPTVGKAVPAKHKSLVWIPIAELVGMVLILTIVISLRVWCRVHQGRAAIVPAEEPILDVAIEDELPPPPITFRCSVCKKGLRVKADLVGKKVKCSRCGQAVRVPDARMGEASPLSS
jgi:hypothetical protein